MVQPLWKKLAVLIKLKIHLCNLAIPPLGISPKEIKTYDMSPQRQMFKVASPVIVKN